MKKISWFSLNYEDVSGEHWYSQGYYNAALSTIKGLNEKDCAVFYNREDIPFHVNFCPATYYQYNSKYTVGYSPWESTKIPDHWIYNMRRCDEIWATSEFTKNVYENSGISANVHVIPHGVSPEFEIFERELTNRFIFLHVGGDSKRKNAQMAVDAFLELFEGKDEYRLVMKYNKFCYAEIYMEDQLVPATYHPQIIGMPDQMSTDELVRLYHKSHCLIYPTMGEGFGLIPLEAMATGLPTIVTNATGCKDYAHLGIPLQSSFIKAEWNNQLYNSDTGEWASPNFEQLLNLMENVVDEYDEFKKFAVKSARIIHSEWSWASTADKILKRLEFYENSLQ